MPNQAFWNCRAVIAPSLPIQFSAWMSCLVSNCQTESIPAIAWSSFQVTRLLMNASSVKNAPASMSNPKTLWVRSSRKKLRTLSQRLLEELLGLRVRFSFSRLSFGSVVSSATSLFSRFAMNSAIFIVFKSRIGARIRGSM